MKFKTLELLIRLEARVSEDGRSGGKQKNRSRYLKELQNIADTDHLKNWFWEQTRDICRNMESAKEKQSETVMEKAQSYIRENFQKDLTLDEVSRVADISPYYFSKLFKQEDRREFYRISYQSTDPERQRPSEKSGIFHQRGVRPFRLWRSQLFQQDLQEIRGDHAQRIQRKAVKKWL